MRLIITGVLLLFLQASQAYSQTNMLTLEDAIATGLNNNFSIRIAKNTNEITKNNNSIGNAGFLPKFGVSSSVRKSVLATETESTGGVVSKSSNDATSLFSMGVSLDWTLFDGFKMFIQKDKLGLLQKQGETSARVTVENVLSEIVVTYHSIIQNKNRLKVLQDAINFSNKRRELIMRKYQIGSASELAYLQSVTDLNADSAAYLRQQVTLKNAKADLNFLLVTDPASNYEVSDTITFLVLPDYKTLVSSLSGSNAQIELANQNSAIAEMNYRLTHSPKYPQIDFFTDYNFNRSKYNFGTTSLYKNHGPVIGLGLSYSIFDGFSRRRNSANALIQRESSDIQLQQVTKEIESQVFQMYNDYQNNLKLVKFEADNVKISRRNTFIAFEKFRLGELSDIDLRQIQIIQLEAENSLLLAQFQAKQSETELLRISGKILSAK
ncbi:MAG: TolC family protein [Bacteroidia bacterium]|nr:TolC family protein [Bacteroidia bacterium]